MREFRRERIWERAAERLVKLPGIGISPEEIGGLLADAFQPMFAFEKGTEKTNKLRQRGDARRRLRELIESKLKISLP